jgi:hypothetical protein
MKFVSAALREIYALFVDNGSLALAIVLWLLFVWLALPRDAAWTGPALAAGLAVLLIENVLRSARK